MSSTTMPSTPYSMAVAAVKSPSMKSPKVNDSPAVRSSPSVPNNYHPYLIQSTSSSLLTRSNSSPSQPIAELRHKPSRSMSSLAASASEGELDKVAAAGVSREEKERRRRSTESPLTRPGMRRSGTLPMFPRMESTPTKFIDVPMDPKLWTPSELARYLAQTLRTGGPDGTGQTLPAPLVKDIETWVLRQQVTGRAFLKGNQETWTSSSRPPPFLPLLLSISRRLRRSSLQSRMSTESAAFSPTPLNYADQHTGSVLFEQDENEDDDGDYSPLSGVRRMANAYESHATTPELGDEPEPLKAQWTGGSNTSEVWRRWEDMGVGVRRKRRESERSLGAGNMADEEISPAARSAVLSSGSGDEVERLETPNLQVDEDEAGGGTVKGSRLGLGLGLGVGLGISAEAGKEKGASPPPPYRSPNPDQSPALLAVPLEDATDTPPRNMRASVTPTPEHPRQSFGVAHPVVGDEDSADQESPHMSNTSTHRSSGSDPYAALRQASSSSRLRSMRRVPDDLEVPETLADITSRRVTIRPNHVDSLFAPPSPSVKSPREAELESQLAQLVSRVKELETKLETVSGELIRRTSAPVSPISREMMRPGSPVGMLPDSILARLGLVPEQEGLPTRVRELPAYLFFVGVGVGAVVVRAFMRRR